MDKKNKVLEVFNEFAKERLENHQAELDTRYDNEKIDNETIKMAYTEHQKIYRRELDEKRNDLLSTEKNTELKKELENAGKGFLDKLSLKQP